MSFLVDQRIESGSVFLAEGPVSKIFLKKDANFPWIILVPREAGIREIYQLPKEKRQQLIEEVAWLSEIMDGFFQPDKLNVAALGNIVPQLHIHLVARFKGDKAWPHSVWQADLPEKRYDDRELYSLVDSLQELLISSLLS